MDLDWLKSGVFDVRELTFTDLDLDPAEVGAGLKHDVWDIQYMNIYIYIYLGNHPQMALVKYYNLPIYIYMNII